MNAPETLGLKPAARGETPLASAASHIDHAQQAERQRRSRRATFIKWLRKVHGWVGLWGAALGLLFGTTGFLLNHRAGPLQISPGKPQVEQLQIALPQPAPSSPDAMADWLKGELQSDGRVGKVKKEPAHPVAWGDRQTVQPEFWQFNISGPKNGVQAEYWVGNGFVSVKRSQNSFFATLNNLHKGTGLSVGWVLLIDTLAGAIILLSLTGVLLWTELNKRRTVGVVLVAGSVGAALLAGLI
ncbi:peptidase [Trinickia terrae]|uniref:Peptidase n=1 Tax=Trinickia terrae TaxID=2571161 RepID=A0A4U1I7B4_9BURK|nr:PepSY-associated TM helix domain-containing protein [Trinickia terrae]TKC89288.1 peptidase [Trinickia terrae]